MSHIGISQTKLPVTEVKPKADTIKVNQENSSPAIKMEGDKLNIKSPKTDFNFDSNNDIFGDKDKDKKGFGVKSVYLKAGYIVKNDVLHTGPMHIKNEGDGTDMTISGAKQIQRGSWSYIDPTQVLTGKQRFSPDEPQFNIGLGMKFNNNFGLEIDAKHNKIIMDGYDQEVHFEGMMNGQYVNMNAPLNTYMSKHEQTFGNLALTVAPTYTFNLLEKGKHSLSLTTKAGPNLITSNTRSGFKNSDGEWESQTSKLQVVGFGAMVENEIEYKHGRVGLAVGHSFSALNYKNYEFGAGGTGSHKALNSAFTAKITVDIFQKK